METKLRKWRINDMFKWTLIVLLFLLNCFIGHANGNYKNSTQVTLCAAQCEAVCLDQVVGCEQRCVGERYWINKCDDAEYHNTAANLMSEFERRKIRAIPNERRNCPGTCSVLSQGFRSNKGHILRVPNVSVTQIDSSSVLLSWPRPLEVVPSSMSPLTAIYIVEETHTNAQWTAVTSTALKSWNTATSYRIDINDVCNLDRYRVMAINQFGTNGFSPPVKLPGMKPGIVQNIRYVGSGVYYYKNEDVPSRSQFMAILQWDTPAGWKDSDIDHYEWNPMVRRRCNDVTHDNLPSFARMKNQTNHILMTIASNALGCVFMPEVRAVSRCNVTGNWTNFSVALTNCSSIMNYRCSTQFVPPDKVRNVTLSISSTPVEEQYINPKHMLINLHINWRPPQDKGSSGTIHHYMIRSGKVKINYLPIPAQFSEAVKTINVSNDIVQLTFELPTSSIPYDYGIQVIAVGPDQSIEEKDLGLYRVYTIQVSRNSTGIGQLKEGKVLLDKDGIVIIYINNWLPVTFGFDSPTGRKDNNTIDRFAVQWGPLVGPDENMQIENQTILPFNESMLSATLPVYLRHTDRQYGIKVLYLDEDAEDPVNEDWDDTPVVSFTLPQSDEHRNESTYKFDLKKFVPFAVVGGTIMLVVILTISVNLLRRRQHFKHLEQLLAASDDGSDDGDHYFVMRPSNNGGDEEIPPVVADRWELPHCCLKMGRTLGCGAFGQVVKGRVSKTLLQHRGVDSHMISQRKGMHVTVAIKMLQDGAEEKQTDDFLNEIYMMKNIGYHRNIVSILGCCTLRQPYCLVVEHMANGDLLSYFRKIRSSISQREQGGDGYINQDIDLFSPQDLLSVARQISNGMAYLSQKGYVHRDLAARNILVGDNKLVKIGDFGLTRYIYYDLNKIYVNRGGGKLPLRWMAPEAIFDLIYSSASDVWSYGILLYEIVSLGASPYPSLSNTELLQALKHGYRMDRPDNCSQEIYDLMQDCWNDVPELRPTFTNICQVLTSMLEEDAGQEYFTFNMPLDHDYYRIKTDEMDIDDMDLGNMSCHSEDTIESVITTNQLGTSQAVVTQIPDDCCSITELSKAELQVEEPDYTDKAFRPTRLSVSSIDNSLYSAMENATGLAGEMNDKIIVHIGHNAAEFDGESDQDVPEHNVDSLSESSRTHRTSDMSDEVFFHCDVCSKLTGDDELDSNICSTCNRTNFTLSPNDIHVSEGNDSAICSTASYESDHNGSIQSELLSATSDEYLMPDSPFLISVTTNENGDQVSNSKDKQTFDFNEIQNEITKTTTLLYAHNPCYMSAAETDRTLRNMLYNGSVINNQPITADEKWCIAHTKL